MCFVIRYSVVIHGVESTVIVPTLSPRIRPSFENDFLCTYPNKSISGLNSTEEDGTFIVFAIVDGLVDGHKWWYPACKCHRSVTLDYGAYYCKGCVKHAFHVAPRLVFIMVVYHFLVSSSLLM